MADIIDKRAGRRKPKPLSQDLPLADDLAKTYAKNPKQIQNFRWARGHSPEDPMKPDDSPWFYPKIEVVETPDSEVQHNPFSGLSGPDAGVRCFDCKRTNYRIIDKRIAAEVLASLPAEQWRRSQGRYDWVATPDVLQLLCPACEHVVEMREETVQQLARQQSGGS